MTTTTEAQPLADSELILTPEGRIYHLNLKPDELADTVLTVGDPDRVPLVSQYFDDIELKVQHRELVTHTGTLNGKRLSVVSTGMGTPNIDIVINELDALVNVDFETRLIKPTTRSLSIIRLGTAGGLQPDVPVGSFALTDFAIGLDNLLWYYPLAYSEQERSIQQQLQSHFEGRLPTPPYIVEGDSGLRQQLAQHCVIGMTATCVGFYGPQNRRIRAPLVLNDLHETLTRFTPGHSRVINFEMETAAIYGLATLLGHKACSISAILANRTTGEFDADMAGSVDRMIQTTLECL